MLAAVSHNRETAESLPSVSNIYKLLLEIWYVCESQMIIDEVQKEQ